MKKRTLVFCIALIWGIILPTLTLAARPVTLAARPVTLAARPVEVVNNENSPIPVHDVDKPTIQPFQKELNFDFNPANTGGGSSFVVPAGKRLVIEFVSGNIHLEQGKALSFSISANVNGTTAHHRLLLNELWPWGIYSMSYNVSQNLKIYADPLAEVLVYVNNTEGGDGCVFVSVSGYLVDL